MATKKTPPTPVDPEPTDPPIVSDPIPVDPVVDYGLTDRQRTRLEKRDLAEAEVNQNTDYCDNHPDRESVVVTDGTAHNPQAYCDECAANYGVVVPE